MYMQGYNFAPVTGYQQGNANTPAGSSSWQPVQPQAQSALLPAANPPPLPAEAPPPLPDEPPQALLQQQPQVVSSSAGGIAQTPQQTWSQQQPALVIQQWQHNQQWQGQGNQLQQQQWGQAQPAQQTPWQSCTPQWQQQQVPQQVQQWQQHTQQQQPWGIDAQQQWLQPGTMQQHWSQQQQQQQHYQQQWSQGYGVMQQGAVYNQQPYGHPQGSNMQQQAAALSQYPGQQQPPPPQPQQLTGASWNVQPSWGATPPQAPGSHQAAALPSYPMGHQQGQVLNVQPGSTNLPSADCGVTAASGAVPVHQQHYQQPPVPARPPLPATPVAASVPPAPAAQPPSPPQPLNLSELLKPPGRDTRPKRLLFLLRGPSGCGKSHVARTIRQMEASLGGKPPRVHSMDDYFMVDVEQGADDVTATSGGSGSKRRASAVTVQEYQYDTALEPSYWKSLLRAAAKSLSDGLYPLVLLDAPALRADQVREVWKVVQGAGAELLVVNPLTTDPKVCHKQCVHRHTLAFIEDQARLFEPVPATFTSADAASLFEDKHGEAAGIKQPNASRSSSGDISEVDMAVEDDDRAAQPGTHGSQHTSTAVPGYAGKHTPKSSRWEADGDVDQPAGRCDSPDSRTAADVCHAASAGAADASTGRDGTCSSAAQGRKRPKLSDGVALDAFDAEALLAGVNQELELLDTEASAAAAAAAAVPAGMTVAGAMSGMSSEAAGCSAGSSGGKPSGILKKTATPNSKCRKVRVRWPDLVDQEEQHLPGFRIALPMRPLAEVYWVEGLGPDKELWMAEADHGACADLGSPDTLTGAAGAGTHSRHSFADQVRAEHRAEHNLFRSILLGHTTSQHPTSTQQVAGATTGSAAGGNRQPTAGRPL